MTKKHGIKKTWAVIDEEGNPLYDPETGESTGIFTSLTEANKAASKESKDRPDENITVYEAVEVHRARVMEPEVTSV